MGTDASRVEWVAQEGSHICAASAAGSWIVMALTVEHTILALRVLCDDRGRAVSLAVQGMHSLSSEVSALEIAGEEGSGEDALCCLVGTHTPALLQLVLSSSANASIPFAFSCRREVPLRMRQTFSFLVMFRG